MSQGMSRYSPQPSSHPQQQQQQRLQQQQNYSQALQQQYRPPGLPTPNAPQQPQQQVQNLLRPVSSISCYAQLLQTLCNPGCGW